MTKTQTKKEIIDGLSKLTKNKLLEWKDYAKKGELYSDVIEQMQIRLGVDEGLLDEEIKQLLLEAKEKIQTLREEKENEKHKIVKALTYTPSIIREVLFEVYEDAGDLAEECERLKEQLEVK